MKTHPLKFIYLSLILLASLLSSKAFATDWIYLEASATRSNVEVIGTKFNPVLPRVKLGINLYEGIQLEVQYTGSGDDTVAGTKLEIEEITASYLRLETPIRSNMRMFVLLGSAEAKLNVQGSGGATAGTGNYKDFSWGIGIEDRVWTKHTLLTLEYTEYYNHDEVVISGVSLGFKLEY